MEGDVLARDMVARGENQTAGDESSSLNSEGRGHVVQCTYIGRTVVSNNLWKTYYMWNLFEYMMGYANPQEYK